MTKEEIEHDNKLIPHNMKSPHHHRHCNASSGKQTINDGTLIQKEIQAMIKEWEDARCPICMEHPHNAVVLLCSSCDKGCRPLMCDTSYRHSNCLDQYRKRKESDSTSHHNNVVLVGGDDDDDVDNDNDIIAAGELKCPLCRGSVTGWKVDEGARQYLNKKARTCSTESCSFVGTYQELRMHARSVHPTIRPAEEIDSRRQRAWARLQRQTDYEDVLTTIHSAMPGSIIIGDYVVDDVVIHSASDSSSSSSPSSSSAHHLWMRRYLLMHMFGGSGSSRFSLDNQHGHGHGHEHGRGRTPAVAANRVFFPPRQHASASASVSASSASASILVTRRRRRRMWSETLLPSSSSLSAASNPPPPPSSEHHRRGRRRRRLNRDQPHHFYNV